MNKEQLLRELHELIQKENTGIFYQFAVTKLVHDLGDFGLTPDEAFAAAEKYEG